MKLISECFCAPLTRCRTLSPSVMFTRFLSTVTDCFSLIIVNPSLFVTPGRGTFSVVLHAVLFLSCPFPHFVFPSLVSFHSPLPSIKASQLSGHLVTLRCTTWSPASRCRSMWDVSVASPPRCCWTSPI